MAVARAGSSTDGMNGTNEKEWFGFVRTYGRPGTDKKKGLLELTVNNLHKTFAMKELERISLVLCKEDPHLERYMKIIVSTVWNDRLLYMAKGAENIMPVINSHLPEGSRAVVFDDNIAEILCSGRASHEVEIGELNKFIEFAFDTIGKENANIWGINRSGDRRNSGSDGKAYSTSLNLIYGAMYGFITTKSPDRSEKLITKYGGITDDIERSLRYYALDNKSVVFKAVQVKKQHPPGKFIKTKGGISSLYCDELQFQQSKEESMNKIVEEFPQYIRFPNPGEKVKNKTMNFFLIKQRGSQRTTAPNDQAKNPDAENIDSIFPADVHEGAAEWMNTLEDPARMANLEWPGQAVMKHLPEQQRAAVRRHNILLRARIRSSRTPEARARAVSDMKILTSTVNFVIKADVDPTLLAADQARRLGEASIRLIRCGNKLLRSISAAAPTEGDYSSDELDKFFEEQTEPKRRRTGEEEPQQPTQPAVLEEAMTQGLGAVSAAEHSARPAGSETHQPERGELGGAGGLDSESSSGSPEMNATGIQNART